MNKFDLKAADWEKNPMHWDRTQAIVQEMIRMIPMNKKMTALEFGAGTGIASFMLKDYLQQITMMDSSSEMVKEMNKKIEAGKVEHLQALNFDLEKSSYTGGTFDLVFAHLVLHHIADTGDILAKLCRLLNPGGYLAIADLYREDGTFHGADFNGHNGFDPSVLSDLLKKLGMTNISHRPCFTIEKQISPTETKAFSVFLLTASRQ